jgi:hypothetical protein
MALVAFFAHILLANCAVWFFFEWALKVRCVVVVVVVVADRCIDLADEQRLKIHLASSSSDGRPLLRSDESEDTRNVW